MQRTGRTVYSTEFKTKPVLEVLKNDKTSSTMDEAFVIGTSNKALLHYGKPEIFNTNQGSVYTGDAHTNLLNNTALAYQWMALAGQPTT